MKTKKVIAITLITILLTGMLFLYDFMIENAHHDCTGKDCPICLQLEEAQHFISCLKIVPILPFVMAILCVFTQGYKPIQEHVSVIITLIILKVELLN